METKAENFMKSTGEDSAGTQADKANAGGIESTGEAQAAMKAQAAGKIEAGDKTETSENENKVRIVAFLCEWCSYAGADAAGTARLRQPEDIRIIRVPCSGRINPLFVLKAFNHGADGVLVSGCHPNDCHFSEGNFYARRRLEVLKEFLPIIGIDKRRFSYQWVSASEATRWQKVVINFVKRIRQLRLIDAQGNGS